MTIISLIVVMDEQRGIGMNNKLLCHLPADLKHFKQLTMGKPIVMGHNTYKSIGKPLPGRLNIVLSKQNRKIDGVSVVHSFDEVFALTKEYAEIVVIGGEQIYKESFRFVERIYLTLIHHRFNADTYFIQYDLDDWFCKKLNHKPVDEKNSFAMTFYQYDLKAKK
jgi:dihydrofolate reductase